MATSYGALCHDFYVNSKLAVKMDLPNERDTVLHLFDRLRKNHPSLDRFRRFEEELLLETSRQDRQYACVSLRKTSLRAGVVNPEAMGDAYKFHHLMLDLAPHFLSISPLDVDYIELMFGFDLDCECNHDRVIADALFRDGPLGQLLARPIAMRDEARPQVEGIVLDQNHDEQEMEIFPDEGKLVDVQPVFGMTLNQSADMQAFFEIKTRTRCSRGNAIRNIDDPLSIFLTVRKYGPCSNLEELLTHFEQLKDQTEILASERLIPHLLLPIQEQITVANSSQEHLQGPDLLGGTDEFGGNAEDFGEYE